MFIKVKSKSRSNSRKRRESDNIRKEDEKQPSQIQNNNSNINGNVNGNSTPSNEREYKSVKVREIWIGNLPNGTNYDTIYTNFFIYGEISKIELYHERVISLLN